MSAHQTLLMPLPDVDFDPTEAAVTWTVLVEAGHVVEFATPSGRPGSADPIMVTGRGLGPLSPFMRADARGRAAYERMVADVRFQAPMTYEQVQAREFDGLVLPGGHAKGMRPYLESSILHHVVGEAVARGKVIGAICHGVVLAARSPHPETGASVLRGRKVTALPRSLEMLAWNLTRAWMGDYYRTYLHTTVEDEVTQAVGPEGAFLPGPLAVRRDRPEDLSPGFVVKDGRCVFGRWPGDAHHFGVELVRLLGEG